MSKYPGVDQTLELLEQLRTTVREFAAREEKLSQETRGKISALQRRRDQTIENVTQQFESDMGKADADYRETRDAAEAQYMARKTEITETHRIGLKTGTQEIENKEGSRKHKLQTDELQSKRNREQGLAAAATRLAEFKSALTVEQETLAALEDRARSSFSGYRRFGRFLSDASLASGPEPSGDEDQHLVQLRELLNSARGEVARFRRRPVPAFFRLLPLWVVLVFVPLPLVPLLPQLGVTSFSYLHALATTGGCLVLGFGLHWISRRGSEPAAKSIATRLVRARRLHDLCLEKSETRHAQDAARLEKELQEKRRWIDQEWHRAIELAEVERASLPQQIEEKTSVDSAANDEASQRKLEDLEHRHKETLARLNRDADARKHEAVATCAKSEAKVNADADEIWKTLETEWRARIQPLWESANGVAATADKMFPAWVPAKWEKWSPPAQFAGVAKFARLDADLAKASEGLPKDPRLALPGPAQFPLPLQLVYPAQGSVLFEAQNSDREPIVGALNNIILRLLSQAPAGRLSFTVIDPVGLGQSFSGVMHLADYAEHLINSRIWTQTNQIEQRLADLNDHMEKVIQMYLRNEYATIAEYNEQAGNIAEKYHFVVVADFPAGFSDLAARRLMSIAASGARCGVFTLIHWDRRQQTPQDFVPDELRKSSVTIACKGTEFSFAGKSLPGTTLKLDPPPAPEFAIDFIHRVGLASRDSNRVEVPFSHVTPAESERWSLDTTNELRVAIGRTGATKLQYLAIGKGTRQHGLVAGKTGSGKSTLFHVAITNLALWCSPEQVEFYLIDFKKGVEFKCYATNRLPHARVVAIESDREFGLSVLHRLDEELKRRGEMFRQLGVQDIAGYKRASGTEPVPRCLLVIDEFQEFFVEDDKIAQTASLLLDRIVRQGRAFGIHVLLGSQTLGGAYTVARTTLGQMVIRIALQCNEADAYLIMDDNNPAPRLLSRPGEGIYNDTAGTMEGNSPFQVVWLPDEERDAELAKVRALANSKAKVYPAPIVFEGNAPADVRENELLRALLDAAAITPTHSPRIWLGAPNSIKGPTEVVFHRQSGNNLLIVGQRDEASLAIVSLALVALAAQHARDGVRLILCDGTAPGTAQREFMERVVRAIPHSIMNVKPGDLAEVMTGLDAEMKRRADDSSAAEAPPVFLILNGLQKFNKLRHEEDFGFSGSDAGAAPNPATILNNLICEGTRLGLHVIAACDTYNNVNRFVSRKALTEFEMRVLFQMSANDSASLIDNPKASTLGLHRALFYNQQEGHLETFRPYALPNREWIEQVAAKLAKLV